MKMRFLAVFLALHNQCGRGFLPSQHLHAPRKAHFKARSSKLFALQQEEGQSTKSTINEEAARLKKEAEMMRLQAEKMDMSLTLEKIEALEAKLQNKAWLERHPEQEADLQLQLQRLKNKLIQKDEPVAKTNTPVRNVRESKLTESLSSQFSPSIAEAELKPTLEPKPKQKQELPEVPLAGFDDSDLQLYVPVANDINKMNETLSIQEKLELFRSAPELQEHFQNKIKKMFVGPMEDMQRLESLKQEYLNSSSSKEREALKRQIDKMESALEDDGPFMYSDEFYCENLEPLSPEELKLRVEAVHALPDILVEIYKQRNGMEESDDVSLAVQWDYYDPQIQLLDQARLVDPLPDDMRESYVKAFNSLPQPVQDRYCSNLGLEKGSDAKKVLETVMKDTSPLSPLMQVVEASNNQEDLPEYNDIDFVDRSRFLEEFYPSVGNMEGGHPSQTDVKMFISQVLDKKCFMVTSKPERVAGGYYIRGTNLLSGDENGSLTAADKLMGQISKDLESSPLAEKLDFFYILDPAPPTDEEMELGPFDKPLLLVTTKDRQKLYNWAKPATKLSVSMSGMVSAFMFSVGACALNPAISDRFYATLDEASTSGVLDLQWFADLCFPIFLSLGAIQVAHEAAHRIVAIIYGFDIGLPNLVPSVTTGIAGAITPLKSPPPNSKALFDFAIGGPAVGLLVSLFLLVSGLELTASMGVGSELPVLPVSLLRASSLGGGMVQFFLGNIAVMPNQGVDAVVQLHPFAIAGVIGCITNALTLLPLGHTDGGRISLAMFGRRGSFVVKLFTTLLLCAAGIFGLDEVNIFLTYVLFASIWQRELETPTRNEVDELDFPRGLAAISAALLAGLILIPMF